MENYLEFFFWFMALLNLAALFMTVFNIKRRACSDIQQDRYHHEILSVLYGLCTIVLFVLVLCTSNLLP